MQAGGGQEVSDLDQEHLKCLLTFVNRTSFFFRWMEACLGEELPAPTELEEALRNGVILAKLGHRFAPSTVPQKKIYDPEQLRYQVMTHTS